MTKPNIVLITTDQQNPRPVGDEGDPPPVLEDLKVRLEAWPRGDAARAPTS